MSDDETDGGTWPPYEAPPPAPQQFPDQTPEEVLHRVFGFQQFRGLQKQAVEALIKGEDALVLMPTAGAKAYVTRYRR